jgi:hypothetical protein
MKLWALSSGWHRWRVGDSIARINTSYRSRAGECWRQVGKSESLISSIRPVPVTGPVVPVSLSNCALGPSTFPMTFKRWPHLAHYIPILLASINRENVAKLKVAWVFHTGDISDGHDGRKWSSFESTPILVDGKLYLTTPFNRVIALDPVTGKQLWSYDPKIDQTLDYGDGLINRGATTWLDPSAVSERVCKRCIFEAMLDARLIVLDAATGTLCRDFGTADRWICGMFWATNMPTWASICRAGIT